MQRMRTRKGLTGLIASGGLAVLAVVLGMTVSVGDARAQSGSGGGYLGVTLQDMNSELRESYSYQGSGGVLVSGLDHGGPASEGGIKQGDIILRFKGRSIESTDDLADRVSSSEPGETVAITVWRSGQERSLKVDLGSRSGSERRRIVIDDDDHHIEIDPDDFKDLKDLKDMKGFTWVQPHMEHGEDIADDIRVQITRRARLGVRTQDLNDQLGEYFGVTDGSGVLVIEVIEDTPAAKAGVRAGDIITQVDGERVENSSELREDLAGKDEGEVRITILRKGSPYSLTAELEKSREPRYFSFRDHPGEHGRQFEWHDNEGHEYRWFNDEDGPRRQFLDDGDMDELREELREMQRELSKMRRELRDTDSGRK
jgi:serine protease Do